MYKKFIAVIAAFALMMVGLVAFTSPASATNEDCTPSAGSLASFSEWTFSHYTDWKHDSNVFADPDGEDGEGNSANLSKIGSIASEKHVTQVFVAGVAEIPAVTKTVYTWTKDNGNTLVLDEGVTPPGNLNNWTKGDARVVEVKAKVPAVAEVPEESHSDYRATVLTRTYTAAVEPVVCNDEPTAPPTHREVVCHATGNGWIAVPPAQASSHIGNGQPTQHNPNKAADFLLDEVYPTDESGNAVKWNTVKDTYDALCAKGPGGKKVTPEAPIFTDPCGVGNWTVSESTSDDYTYQTKVNNKGTKVTVTAVPVEGVTLKGPKVWKFDINDELCPEIPTKNPTTRDVVSLGEGDCDTYTRVKTTQTYTTTYVWNAETDKFDGTETLTNTTNETVEWIPVGDECETETPVKPNALVDIVKTSGLDCDDKTVTTVTTTTTTDWVLNDTKDGYVKDAPVTEVVVVTKDAKASDCPVPPKRNNPVPPKKDKDKPAAVPTAVAAGQGTLPNTGGPGMGLIGLGLLSAGAGAALMFGRKSGNHNA